MESRTFPNCVAGLLPVGGVANGISANRVEVAWRRRLIARFRPSASAAVAIICSDKRFTSIARSSASRRFIAFSRRIWLRQRDHQHTTNATHGADDLARHRGRVHVAVADSGHGDAGPPEAGRYAGEVGVRLVLFGEVHKTAEHHHTHRHEQHQQA
ncbi:hypothetical protein T11_15226 [Trichinella zimbabwensis]|uniref:Uncharacterized protein n=1 Tax=Trichinella zimbabwensis TaxID=268475 RepID=A0A0V1HMN2_9BILA|nr:hypothetical protein T11_15226 [Trichinella zimbabwensis]